MARFHSHSQTGLLGQIFCSFLLLIFMIIIHPSCGNDDEALQDDLVIEICNQTSDCKFCLDNVSSDQHHVYAPPPFGKAHAICNSVLFSAHTRADEARSFLASLLENSSSTIVQPHARQLLQRCQLLNDMAITYLSSANHNLNLHTNIYAMVEDLNTAANATKSCHGIIQRTGFSELAEKNSDLIKLCEICVVSSKFITIDY